MSLIAIGELFAMPSLNLWVPLCGPHLQNVIYWKSFPTIPEKRETISMHISSSSSNRDHKERACPLISHSMPAVKDGASSSPIMSSCHCRRSRHIAAQRPWQLVFYLSSTAAPPLVEKIKGPELNILVLTLPLTKEEQEVEDG